MYDIRGSVDGGVCADIGLRVVTPRVFVGAYRRFGGTHFFHLQSFSTFKTKIVNITVTYATECVQPQTYFIVHWFAHCMSR
jgi:hypothetical protein